MARTGRNGGGPLRIAIFLPSLEVGGAERAMLNLASGLGKTAGLQVEIVVAQARGRYLQEVLQGQSVVDLASPRVSRSLFPLVRYLRRRRPAVMISAMEHANIIAIVARGLVGFPECLVVSSHTLISLARRGQIPNRAAILPYLARLAYPLADAVVAISQAVATDLERTLKLDPKKIHVIPNPIVADDILHGELNETSRSVRDRSKTVLFVGRLAIEKDLPTLFRAFRLVNERRKALLIIVGEGPQRPRLQQLAEELQISSKTTWAGFVEDPYPIMRQASVLVLPSRWEGLGAVVVEALACGCSVVATDGPGGVREILDDGRYGTLVPVGDHGAMAEAIVATLDAPFPPEILRQRAKEYTVEVIAARYLDLIRSCLPAGMAPPVTSSLEGHR